MPPTSSTPAPVAEPEFPFRVSVDFVDRPDYVVPMRTQDAADAYIEKVFKQGYVVIDRSDDESNLYTIIVPIGQVSYITVHDAPR